MRLKKRKQKANIRYFKTIDTVPAWNYFKAKEQQDTRFLLKLEDYEDLPEVNALEQKILDDTFEQLTIDIADFELKLSRKTFNLFQLTLRAAKLEAEMEQVNNILRLLHISGHDNENEKLLKKYGYSIRSNKSFEDELKRIFNQNKNKNIRIKELHAEIDAIAGKTTDETPIERVQIAIEKYNNRDIDIRSISLKKWLTLKNDLAIAIERQQAKNAKHGK